LSASHELFFLSPESPSSVLYEKYILAMPNRWTSEGKPGIDV